MPQAKELIGDIGMDNVTIHLDTYHMNIEENSMEQAIQAAGDKLGCLPFLLLLSFMVNFFGTVFPFMVNTSAPRPFGHVQMT